MIKARSETADFAAHQSKSDEKPLGIAELVDEMADRVYEQPRKKDRSLEKPISISISLQPWQIEMLTERAFINKKRKSLSPRTVSGLIRECLENAGYKLEDC